MRKKLKALDMFLGGIVIILCTILLSGIFTAGLAYFMASSTTHKDNFEFKKAVLVYFVGQKQQALAKKIWVGRNYSEFTTPSNEKIIYVGDYYFVEPAKKELKKEQKVDPKKQPESTGK